MQPHPPTRTRGRRPGHAGHRAQQGAVHRRQRRQRLPCARIAALAPAQRLFGQRAHHLVQHLGGKQMLAGGETRRGQRGRANLAHLAAMAGVTERAQTRHHRIEHGEEIRAKIILREEGAALVLFRRGERSCRQQRQHLPAKTIQQPPVLELLFADRFAFAAHVASKPEVPQKYKLQSRYKGYKTMTMSAPQATHKPCRTQLRNLAFSRIISVWRRKSFSFCARTAGT